MSVSTIITLERLKTGARSLGLAIPQNITFKGLERLIKDHIAKDGTYGAYGCEACGKDIVNGLKICPFCSAEFLPVDEGENEDIEDAEFTEPTEVEDPPQPSADLDGDLDVVVEDDDWLKASKPIKPKAKKKKPLSKTAAARKRQNKEEELERRRAQVKLELPYSKEQLQQMKRTTLLMVAGVLGIHNPIKLGSADNLIKAILKKQTSR